MIELFVYCQRRAHMSPVAVMGQIQRIHPEERRRQQPKDKEREMEMDLKQLTIVFSSTVYTADETLTDILLS